MSDATIVYVRDRSSGKVHKRFRMAGSTELSSFEADNADESGAFDELPYSELTSLPAGSLCRRCWPDPELPEWVGGEADTAPEDEDDATTSPVDPT